MTIAEREKLLQDAEAYIKAKAKKRSHYFTLADYFPAKRKSYNLLSTEKEIEIRTSIYKLLFYIALPVIFITILVVGFFSDIRRELGSFLFLFTFLPFIMVVVSGFFVYRISKNFIKLNSKEITINGSTIRWVDIIQCYIMCYPVSKYSEWSLFVATTDGIVREFDITGLSDNDVSHAIYCYMKAYNDLDNIGRK